MKAQASDVNTEMTDIAVRTGVINPFRGPILYPPLRDKHDTVGFTSIAGGDTRGLSFSRHGRDALKLRQGTSILIK